MWTNHASSVCECWAGHPDPARDGAADHERHGHLAARHVAPLGGVVDDLIHRERDEVGDLQLDDRPAADERGADTGARPGPPRRSARRSRARGPNSSSRPAVTWKSPPIAAMSSPITKTPASRSISSWSASLSASDIVSSRGRAHARSCAAVPSAFQSLGRVDVLDRRRPAPAAARRARTRPRPPRRRAPLPRVSSSALGETTPRSSEVAREAEDRVASPPGVELLGRADVVLASPPNAA